jgi:ABC-type dipeptide/oligopeptide/nickel transport system ATPase subunit
MGKPAKVPKLPDENDKKRMQGGDYDPLGELVELRPEQAKASPSGKPKGQAAAMLALFEAHQGEAFRSLDDKPLFCLTDDGRRQTMQLPKAVKTLALWQYQQTGQPATARSREEVKNHLEALAEAGPKRQTWLRVAEYDGALYLDLGDDSWRVVRIASDGWEVIDRPPVYFVRSGGMLPIPLPMRGGSVAELFDLINVPDSDGQALVLGWLVSALRPSRPMPLLALHAEQGSAKSTTARMLAEVIDPHQAGLRIRPKDEQSVMVSAQNAWVLAFDNLSSLPPWLSDLLCCLSTGASYTARTLYSDARETVMRAQRPVLLTSIEDIASRSDLLDRMIVLTLPTIPEARRRTEQAVLAAFNIAHPRILGALLDAAAHALRTLPDVKLDALPRMADFALWATAAERGLGLAPGGFLTAYRENRQDAHGQALDACPVVEPLEHFMSDVCEWTGTATELLTVLDSKSDQTKRSHPKWPKDGTRLSSQLRRIAPNLRSRGLDYKQSRESGGQRKRLITIAKVAS